MDRLRQRADFLAVANGARANSPAFVLQSRRRDDFGPIRIGFTVTKKNGNAPERNRIRRRLRELVKRLDPVSMLPHHDYVLVGRREQPNAASAVPVRSSSGPVHVPVKGSGPRSPDTGRAAS